MVYPEAPFQLGLHLRVVRHADFLQCLDCTRQTGKVRGNYDFAYLTRQSCRKLKKRKKKRRTGFEVSEARSTDPAASTPLCGALGSTAAAAATAESRVFGNQHTTGGATGSTDVPRTGELGQPTPRQMWLIFRKCNREPEDWAPSAL
eukprot:3874542-Amphidinium_carterae.1